MVGKIKICIGYLKGDFIKVIKYVMDNSRPKTSGFVVNIIKDTYV